MTTNTRLLPRETYRSNSADGRVHDPALQTALNCLRLKLREVKILGTYPVD